MKKALTAIAFITVLLCATGVRADVVCSDFKEIYALLDNLPVLPPDGVCTWTHTNPYPGDYAQALAAGRITGVQLTIVAEDVDKGDKVNLYYVDDEGDQQKLGTLVAMSSNTMRLPKPGPGHRSSEYVTVTTFDLDPAWLATSTTMAAKVAGFILDNPNLAEIETSELCVSYVVPLPGALLLGAVGLSVVGWWQRRSL